jgi:hypothetical protein
VQDRVEALGHRGVVVGQPLGNVALDEREQRVVGEVGDVFLRTGHEVVDRDHRATPRDQGVDEV